MTYQNLRDHYTHVIYEWLQRNKYTATPHVVDVIISILLHRDRIIDHGGSCVKAFMNNNLHDVIRYADTEVMQNLRMIYQAYQNIETYHAAQAYLEYTLKKPADV